MNPTPLVKDSGSSLDINLNISTSKHKIDYTNNVGMVFGGLVFMAAGYLGERHYTKDNGFKGIARVVSPGRFAMVLGGGCVVIGLTIRL